MLKLKIYKLFKKENKKLKIKKFKQRHWFFFCFVLQINFKNCENKAVV